MPTITLIRHEESTYNRYRMIDFDSSLTKDGMKRCEKLKGNYDMVVCSKMKRARQTLYYSCISFEYLYITKLCREIRKGNIVDMITEDEAFIETDMELKQRILTFKMLIRNMSILYNNICVVTHGGFVEKLTGIKLNNGASVIYTFD